MDVIGKIKNLIQGQSRSAMVKKNIIASFGIKGVSILVSFALVPMTIGYVSSELYGVWLTLSSILTWLCFLDIGFSQGLKNKLAEAIALGDWTRGKSLVSTTYFMMLLIFIPVCLLLEAIIPLIDWCYLLNVNFQYQNEIKQTMGVLIAFACLQMIVNVLVSVIAAFQKVALSNSFSVIGNMISLVIISVLTKVCPPSLLALAFSLAAMPIFVTIIASIILYSGKFKSVAPSVRSINCSYIRDLFGLGYKFFIINIQVVVLYQSTNVLISYVSSPEEVATYNIAYKLLNIAMMTFVIISGPLWPAYTDAYARGDFEWMKNMRKKMKLVLFYTVLGCFSIALLSTPIYKFWIGGKIEIPFTMTLIVAVYVSVYCWMKLNTTLLVGIGKIHVETITVVIGMLIHVPLSLFLSKFFSAYGVITSMILVNLLYAIVFGFQVRMILNKKAKGLWNK